MTTNHNLLAHFLEIAARAGDKPFLIDGETPLLRFSDLDRETGRLAARLIALGGAAGERVVVQVDKSPAAVLLYLAALRAGMIFVPLNTAYTAAELAYFLGDAEPAVVVCRPADEAAVRAMAGVAAVVTLGVDGFGSLMDVLPDEAAPVAMRAGDDLAAILYTSGTTGRSKGAMLSHGNLYSNAATLKELWQWDADDVLIHILPIYHVHGLFV
ncbi:MAG: AMP-binding protein, partial [Pseudomonadota bacterium]|nr:AMP-binding protein [Pseudomonadota bacterium]